MSSSAIREGNGEGSSTPLASAHFEFETDSASDNDDQFAQERERAVLGEDYLDDDLQSRYVKRT
jgi:hypothetical protein